MINNVSQKLVKNTKGEPVKLVLEIDLTVTPEVTKTGKSYNYGSAFFDPIEGLPAEWSLSLGVYKQTKPKKEK